MILADYWSNASVFFLYSQRHLLFIGTSTSATLIDTITKTDRILSVQSTRTMTGHLMFVEFTSDSNQSSTDLRFRINVVAVGDYCKCYRNLQTMGDFNWNYSIVGQLFHLILLTPKTNFHFFKAQPFPSSHN